MSHVHTISCRTKEYKDHLSGPNLLTKIGRCKEDTLPASCH